MWWQSNTAIKVALRKESVDRNPCYFIVFFIQHVALRKESVDRNHAWGLSDCPNAVALRKESVDRNWQDIDERETISASLSARRAWIEIKIDVGWWSVDVVALRKESVDRNPLPRSGTVRGTCRSPQGERG